MAITPIAGEEDIPDNLVTQTVASLFCSSQNPSGHISTDLWIRDSGVWSKKAGPRRLVASGRRSYPVCTRLFQYRMRKLSTEEAVIGYIDCTSRFGKSRRTKVISVRISAYNIL